MIQLDQDTPTTAPIQTETGMAVTTLGVAIEPEPMMATTTTEEVAPVPTVGGIDEQIVQDEQNLTPEGSSQVGVAVLDRSELPKDNAWIWWVAAGVLVIAIVVVIVAMVTKKNKKGGEKTTDDVE